jgi:hypothetical protein
VIPASPSMTMSQPSFDFEPDARRAALLTRLMHAQLAASLSHIRDRADGIVEFDRAGLDRTIRLLESGGTLPPATFADYYELVPALAEGDEDRARPLFGALAAAEPVPPGLRVVALGDDRLGAASERYARLMNGDPSMPLGFLPPSAELAADFRTRLARGFDLMERAIPELAGEIRAIINEVVIVAGDRTKKFQFDGGSHFQLWGALFLNAEYHQTDLAVVEVLAHECAHSLLFGFCTEEPLVLNRDDELYTSPLRPDPRPMDGIYHATFVSARMHWAMSRLAASALLDEGDRQRAVEAAAKDARNFEAGHAVVAAHGRLTRTGSGLMEAARRYMDGAAAAA